MRPFLLVGFALLSLIPSFAADATAAKETPAPAPASATEDLSGYKTAETLWKHIDGLKESLTTAGQNGDEEAATTLVPKLQAALNAFIAKYPKDSNVWDGKLVLAQLGLLSCKMELPAAPTLQQAMQAFDALSKDKDAPKETRAEATLVGLIQTFSTMDDTDDSWNLIDAKIESFQKEFGNFALKDQPHPIIVMLRTQELQMLKMSKSTANTTRFQALLKKLAADPQPEIAAMAKEQIAVQQRVEDLKTKPVALKFTSVDGKEIDIAKMKGKVVLVDFWATWCPPCVAEMPGIVATYKKYHDQGLEIVGISLDQDKNTMLSYTKQNGMVWPQFFDGKGWENGISTSYGIVSIPTLWLIDQKGMLAQVIETPAEGDDIGIQVEKLLKK